MNFQENLNEFLIQWDNDYKKNVIGLNLFNRDLVKKWSNSQRQFFIKIFYHSRGHFKDFLWHLGNYAPNKNIKDIILKNIEEEFGEDKSHEELYLDFCAEEGIDLSTEYIDNKYNIQKMREFNTLHLDWLYAHKNWISKFAAFSAYERLDSTDYTFLSNALFEDSTKEHLFFKIHRQAEHFEKTYIDLLDSWITNKDLVVEAFTFIADSQLKMWQDLSSETFSFS